MRRAAIRGALIMITAALLWLPDAASSPLAESGPTGLWRVAVLGDSVPAGTGCDCTAYPALYGAGLTGRYHRGTLVADDGESGATSDDLLSELSDWTSRPHADVEQADIVVITIGANDFGDQHDDVFDDDCGSDLSCTDDEQRQLQTDLTAIVQEVHALRGGRPTAVLITGYWNVFEDGQVAADAHPAAGRQQSADLTAAVDAIEQQVASATGAHYVDLATPFLGAELDRDPTALLAPDGDHPNARGHQVIADALLAAGVAPLPG